jgi:hypothetical protein
MANVKYNAFGKAIAKNDIDTVTIKAMFMNPAYTPDADAHVYVSDISASRAVGTTDLTLSNVTITVDNTDNRTEFDSDNLVTDSITATTNSYVLYISTGVDSTSELLCYVELTDGVTTPKTFFLVEGVLTVTVSGNGHFTI